MLRLTRKHSTRIPHRLAIIAAVLLVTATAAGMNQKVNMNSGESNFAATQNLSAQQEVPRTATSNKRMTKKFKVSLMLLPRR